MDKEMMVKTEDAREAYVRPELTKLDVAENTDGQSKTNQGLEGMDETASIS